jgi:hypothetical protein
MFLVSSLTALSFPPITHPRARTFSSSAITISVDESLYSISLSERKYSHSFANLIVIFHVILSASKQWVG